TDSLTRRRWRSCVALVSRHQPRPMLLPYTALFRSSAAPSPRPRGADGRHRLQLDGVSGDAGGGAPGRRLLHGASSPPRAERDRRSEEHTSELQSRENLVCRLLSEKKNKKHEACKRR